MSQVADRVASHWAAGRSAASAPPWSRRSARCCH